MVYHDLPWFTQIGDGLCHSCHLPWFTTWLDLHPGAQALEPSWNRSHDMLGRPAEKPPWKLDWNHLSTEDFSKMKREKSSIFSQYPSIIFNQYFWLCPNSSVYIYIPNIFFPECKMDFQASAKCSDQPMFGRLVPDHFQEKLGFTIGKLLSLTLKNMIVNWDPM